MTLQILRYLRGQRFHSGDVREGSYGWRNRLVSSGIRAWNSCGELTEITLLKCVYKFLYTVHNQQTLTGSVLFPFMQYLR